MRIKYATAVRAALRLSNAARPFQRRIPALHCACMVNVPGVQRKRLPHARSIFVNSLHFLHAWLFFLLLMCIGAALHLSNAARPFQHRILALRCACLAPVWRLYLGFLACKETAVFLFFCFVTTTRKVM